MQSPEVEQHDPSLRNDILEMVKKADFLQPVPGRCAVVRDGAVERIGLIYIPDKHKQLPTTGTIVAVGDEDRNYLIGKRVVWGRYSGVPVQFEGFPAYDILTYEEIVGFLKKNVTMAQEDLSALSRTD